MQHRERSRTQAVLQAQAFDLLPAVPHGEPEHALEQAGISFEQAFGALPDAVAGRPPPKRTRVEQAAFARKALAAKQQQAASDNRLDIVAQAWNEQHGLRAGDRLVLHKRRKSHEHKNKWGVDGLLRVGFGSVGRAAPGRGGVGETRNGLLAVTSVAHILNRAQHHAF